MYVTSCVEKRLGMLKNTVKWAYEKFPWYRKKMQDKGISPEDITSIDDLKYLPFIYKDDLRNNYPWGCTASDLKDVVRVHCSSGTTGKPTIVSYTKDDIKRWSLLMKWCLEIAGVTEEDVMQVAYGYGLFTGGLGLHYGGEALGCCVIPASGGFTERQLMLMKDLKTTVLACTPSYALYLGEMAKELELMPGKDLHLRIGIFGAEPWSEQLRSEIEAHLGLTALDIYGLSEIWGPGVAMECHCKNGLHVNPDYFIMEIIDPETGEVLPAGAEGELVITTLNREAVPMVRYRTKDITTLIPEQMCECGAITPKIGRIKGRADDLIIVGGVNVFPKQIEAVIGQIDALSLNYKIYLKERKHLKRLGVVCELKEGCLDEDGRIKELLKRKLKDSCGIHVEVELVRFGTLERSMGKAVRVVREKE